MRSATAVLFALFIWAGSACSDPSGVQPDVDAGADISIDDDVSIDVRPGPPDFGADTRPGACTYQSDCDDDQMCIEDTCVDAPGCDGLEDWQRCVDDLTRFGARYALRAYCGGDRCRVACVEDSECPGGQTCTDYGQCVPFDGDLNAPAPGAGARAPLQAGASNVRMNFPIGISLAGYGSRAERGAGRYTDRMSDSVGHFHALYARALALDNGERELLIIRLPIIFASAWLHEEVARRLQEKTGENWRDSLIISTTHSHSGPARFWPVPDDAALEIGRLGSDGYSHVAFEWIVDSTVQAAEAALADKQPAQFGWSIVEAFDTDDAIASDRWGETPPFDDNRLLMLRVDDAQGDPIAAGVSFGMHSTFNESDYLTGDAAGAVERAFEAELGRRYDRFVPVLFLSENNGTMSPRGDRHGHESLQKHELLGRTFADRTIDDFEAIETDDDVALDSTTHIFPITYERVGYEVGQWARGSAGTYESTYYYGAIQCIPGTDEDPETHGDPYDSVCLPTHYITFNRPPTIFGRSMISTLNLDGVTVVTMPGEVSMEVGWQVLREARDRLGLDPAEAFIWGYAQDHQLYITPTNLRGELPSFPGISTPKAPDEYPDFAFSWLQGGYEPSLSVWGYRFGDFMVERAIEALQLLDDPSAEVDAALPAQYTPFSTGEFGVEPSPVGDVGTVVDDVAATIPRLTPVEFSWVGGDPGVEMPQAPLVVLERDDGQGNFEPFLRDNHRRYDNREPVMITRVRRDANRWEWVVYWDELPSFPAGRYRFRVEGHHDVDGDVQSYTVTSTTFELVGTDDLAATVETTPNQVSGTLAYPAATRFEVVGTDDDPGRVRGSYRLRNPDVPTGTPDPVIAGEDIDETGIVLRVLEPGGGVWDTFTGGDITLSTQPANPIPVTTWSADVTGAPAGYTVELEAVDRYGNRALYP